MDIITKKLNDNLHLDNENSHLDNDNLHLDNDNTHLDNENIKSFQSMLIFNDNLRSNIKLSLSIYKKLNNFEHNYIHKIINDKIKSDTK